MACNALPTVAPVVITSSTRTERGGMASMGLKAMPCRCSRSAPAWRLHHNGAPNPRITGRPVIRSISVASASAWSMPYVTRRANDLGTGTRAVASDGSPETIAEARRRPAGSDLRYLRLWTSRTAAPTCLKPASTLTPRMFCAGARASEVTQGSHSGQPGMAHARQSICRPYRRPVTDSVTGREFCQLRFRVPTRPSSAPARG